MRHIGAGAFPDAKPKSGLAFYFCCFVNQLRIMAYHCFSSDHCAISSGYIGDKICLRRDHARLGRGNASPRLFDPR